MPPFSLARSSGTTGRRRKYSRSAQRIGCLCARYASVHGSSIANCSGLRCAVAIQAASASRVCSVSSNWTARWVFFRVPEVSAHHRSVRSSRARCPSGSWTNYGTHTIPSVKNWFARHPCFHVHFTPTSASWLNQVERWFATLTEKQIRRGTHRSTRELERHPRLPAQLQRRALRLDQVGRRPFSTAWNASACEELTQDTSGRTPQAFSLCSLWPSSRSSSPPPARSCAVPPCCRAVSVARTGTRASDAPRFLPGLKVRGRGSQGRAKSIRWSLGALKRERCPSRRG